MKLCLEKQFSGAKHGEDDRYLHPGLVTTPKEEIPQAEENSARQEEQTHFLGADEGYLLHELTLLQFREAVCQE